MKQAIEELSGGAVFRGSAVLKRASRSGRNGVVTGHHGIDRSLGHMARNYRQPIAVMDLVKISGMSRRGFFKAFMKQVGIRPSKLLTHVRIEHAKHLLAGAGLPVGEVARQCGYRSANTFWVAFRRVAGISPRTFQRRPGRARRQGATGRSVDAQVWRANR